MSNNFGTFVYLLIKLMNNVIGVFYFWIIKGVAKEGGGGGQHI